MVSTQLMSHVHKKIKFIYLTMRSAHNMKDDHSYKRIGAVAKIQHGENNQTWTMKHLCDLHWIECLKKSFLFTLPSEDVIRRHEK